MHEVPVLIRYYQSIVSKFKHRFLIILLFLLAVILLAAYVTGLLGVIVKEVVWRLSNI